MKEQTLFTDEELARVEIAEERKHLIECARESVDVQQVFVLFNAKRQTRYTRAEQRRAVNMIRAPPKG